MRTWRNESSCILFTADTLYVDHIVDRNWPIGDTRIGQETVIKYLPLLYTCNDDCTPILHSVHHRSSIILKLMIFTREIWHQKLPTSQIIWFDRRDFFFFQIWFSNPKSFLRDFGNEFISYFVDLNFSERKSSSSEKKKSQSWIWASLGDM